MARKFERRQVKLETLDTLPEDMIALKRKVQILMDLTGAQDIDVEDDTGDADVEAGSALIKDDGSFDNGDVTDEIQT